jgi:hypothetical protein
MATHLLDFDTLADTPLPETRSGDDEVNWLNDTMSLS